MKSPEMSENKQPITPDDLVPGAVIRVPAAYRQRPYCLEITERLLVSKATGAVELLGKVLAMNGTTARKQPLLRRVIVMPDRIEIMKKASLSHRTPENIERELNQEWGNYLRWEHETLEAAEILANIERHRDNVRESVHELALELAQAKLAAGVPAEEAYAHLNKYMKTPGDREDYGLGDKLG